MVTIAATLSYAPFLWEMCFSGRPFLHGIQIFLSGFWVSSRGFDGVLSSIVSSIVSSCEVEAAAAETRDFFPWCCSEGDRCFIRVALSAGMEITRSPGGLSWSPSLWCHVLRSGHSGDQKPTAGRNDHNTGVAHFLLNRKWHKLCWVLSRKWVQGYFQTGKNNLGRRGHAPTTPCWRVYLLPQQQHNCLTTELWLSHGRYGFILGFKKIVLYGEWVLLFKNPFHKRRLVCPNGKGTGVTNNINDAWKWAVACVSYTLQLWVKMSAVKKTQTPRGNVNQVLANSCCCLVL